VNDKIRKSGTGSIIPVPRHCHNHHSADPGGLDLAQTGL